MLKLLLRLVSGEKKKLIEQLKDDIEVI
jgi:hypothetical protein